MLIRVLTKDNGQRTISQTEQRNDYSLELLEYHFNYEV